MTGQELFQLLTIIIFIVSSLSFYIKKWDLELMGRNNRDILPTLGAIFGGIGTIIIIGVWFYNNWNKIIINI